jgi:hypothetical protein
LQRGEMDLQWINEDLLQLEGRIRIIEADLAVVMAADAEVAALRAAKAARATKKQVEAGRPMTVPDPSIPHDSSTAAGTP